MDKTKFSSNISTATELSKLLSTVFNIAKNGYDNLRNVKFYQEYPAGTKPDELLHPCITYSIVNKRPQGDAKGASVRTMDEDLSSQTRVGSGFRGGGYRRPRQREEFPDTDNEGYTIIINNQRFLYLVKFDIWATSNEIADIIAEEFEEFIHTYTGILMNKGVAKILYVGLDTDKIVDWKDDLIHRIIHYEFILENLYVQSTKSIEEIMLQITVNEENLI